MAGLKFEALDTLSSSLSFHLSPQMKYLVQSSTFTLTSFRVLLFFGWEFVFWVHLKIIKVTLLSVKYETSLCFGGEFPFLIDNNTTFFATWQVWLKLWIVIEPLFFSCCYEHCDPDDPLKEVKPLMIPPTQCHFKGCQWSGNGQKKKKRLTECFLLVIYSLELIWLPAGFSLCSFSSLRTFPQ